MSETHVDPRAAWVALHELCHREATAEACRIVVTFAQPHDSQLFADIASMIADHLDRVVISGVDPELTATVTLAGVEAQPGTYMLTTGPDGGVPCPGCGAPVAVTSRDAAGVLATRPAVEPTRCLTCLEAAEDAHLAAPEPAETNTVQVRCIPRKPGAARRNLRDVVRWSPGEKP